MTVSNNAGKSYTCTQNLTVQDCTTPTPVCNSTYQNKETTEDLNTKTDAELCNPGMKTIIQQPSASNNWKWKWTCNAGGSSVECEATKPTPPPESIDCSLSLSPNPVCLGSEATLNWSINGTYTNSPSITVNPALTGFPFAISSASGTKKFTPTALGNYGFSMTVSNNAGKSYTCTQNLTVQDCTTHTPHLWL
jgi:hypothetical protein